MRQRKKSISIVFFESVNYILVVCCSELNDKLKVSWAPFWIVTLSVINLNPTKKETHPPWQIGFNQQRNQCTA